MKKLLILLWTFAGIQVTASAQNPIPNANFENWTTSANGRDSLIGWSSSNAVAMYPVKPLVRDTNAFQGNNAAELITAPFGFVQYTKVSILVNGAATFNWNGGAGYSVTMESGGGTPISFKPSALKGFYKCETFSPASQGWVQVLLTKYNTASQQRDTVGYGTLDLTPTSVYTAFTVPVTDLMPGVTPDSITTIFYSSNPVAAPANGAWSNLYLDSLTLEQPPMPPVADFVADSTVGTTNTVVHLYDSSTNAPTSWQWYFVPNTVTFQNGTTDTAQNPVVTFDSAGVYTVTLVAANADGSDTLTRPDYIHISDAPNGLAEISRKAGQLFFPNPARGTLFFNPICVGATLQIVDVQGRQVMDFQKIRTSKIDVSSLSPGVYFIKLFKNDWRYTGKFMVRD